MRSPCDHMLSGRISKRDVVELKERSFLSKTFFILWQPCFLYLGLRSGKKIEIEREGSKTIGSNCHFKFQTLAQKHTVLVEEQAEMGIACGFF